MNTSNTNTLKDDTTNLLRQTTGTIMAISALLLAIPSFLAYFFFTVIPDTSPLLVASLGLVIIAMIYMIKDKLLYSRLFRRRIRFAEIPPLFFASLFPLLSSMGIGLFVALLLQNNIILSTTLAILLGLTPYIIWHEIPYRYLLVSQKKNRWVKAFDLLIRGSDTFTRQRILLSILIGATSVPGAFLVAALPFVLLGYATPLVLTIVISFTISLIIIVLNSIFKYLLIKRISSGSPSISNKKQGGLKFFFASIFLAGIMSAAFALAFAISTMVAFDNFITF